MGFARHGALWVFLGLAVLFAPVRAQAFDRFSLVVTNQNATLRSHLAEASLLRALRDEDGADTRDVIATARAEYSNLLFALYADGYYSSTINILIDGVEADDIVLFDAPEAVSQVVVQVTPGPRFRFSKALVTPWPARLDPVEGFAAGSIARSTKVREAVETAIEGWRDRGRAKAAVAEQKLVADHRDATLSAEVTIDTGPVVRFGKLVQQTNSTVRPDRIARIAGLPTGKVFSPSDLDRTARRLRRTGAFKSVSMAEAETLDADQRMDILLDVTDEDPNRIGIGAEVSTLDGLSLSGFWLRRNVAGGAERLRIDGALTDLMNDSDEMDTSLAARYDIPAYFGTDIDGYVSLEAEDLDEPSYRARQIGTTFGMVRRISDQLEADLAFAYRFSQTDDIYGHRDFSLFSLPSALTWDHRDNQLNPAGGVYVAAELEPFHDFVAGSTGVRTTLDARGYLPIGEGEDTIFAFRTQIGAVFGAARADIPPDYLFFSGGGGTVRGFPNQSLGVASGGADPTGGKAFLGVSAELRQKVKGAISIVGFADAGHIGADRFFDSGGGWHAGAGAGLRYDTGLGPIRLDVAVPVAGSGGSGPQIYLGIGQAF